jgi:DNA-binding transcriptional LysR family regulator
MFGQPLLVRTVPPRPTEQGQKLLALLRQVELLEDCAARSNPRSLITASSACNVL